MTGVRTIQGVVEKELKDYGSFSATLSKPIEITSHSRCKIAIHKVDCLIPQEYYSRRGMATLYVKIRGEQSFR